MDERIFNNRYRLERRIGDGGMAVVFAGTDILLRRRVAIKVLREQFAADEDFVRRFYHEAQSAAKLSHPNIVNTFDVGRENSTYFIVMELVEGTTLAEMIRADGKIPEPVAIDYAAQICNGLAYAHRQGLLHRDIKPANILITGDDVVKLSDFGIARAVTQQTLTATTPGMVMGSVYYISPEQAQGLELRETSDLYSVGVVLYQMLDGKLPYTGDSPVTVALKHVSEPVPVLDAPDVSPALVSIVERLLQKDPRDRFQSASEVASALREARERPMVASAIAAPREGATTTIPAVERPVRPPPRRSEAPDFGAAGNGAGAEIAYEPSSRRWGSRVYLALILALLLAVAGGYALWGGPMPLLHGIAVTDETGRSAIDAQRDLESRGLHVKLTGVASETVAKDLVVSQNPAPGTQLPAGGEVELLISTGVAPKQLVSVNDFTVADAQKTLEREGFKTKIVEKYSNDKPKDTVISTSPKSGEMVTPGTTVTLNVSKGPAPIAVPDLVGHTLADAQAALTKAKLIVNVQRVALDGVPPEQIASQDPTAGTMVGSGSTVTLTVSNGPALVPVPDVGGKSLGDATEALTAAGFAPKVTYSIQQGGDGTVVQQDPAPSQQARKGTSVSVMIAVPGTVPDVTGMTLDAAKAALSRVGYKPGNISYVQEGEEGKVARTEPVAHMPLGIGETVSLYVNGAPSR